MSYSLEFRSLVAKWREEASRRRGIMEREGAAKSPALRRRKGLPIKVLQRCADDLEQLLKELEL